MEKTLTCPKHSWQLGCRKFDPEGKLVGVIRRCANCGREEKIWEELPVSADFPITVQQVLEVFLAHLKENHKALWREAAKHDPGLGYPWGGILLEALDKTFKDFGLKIEL